VAINIKGTEAGALSLDAGPAVERVRNTAPVSASNPPGSPTSPPDRVNITGAARTLAALQDAIAASPEIDMKRVDQLRQSVDRGTYVPNPAKIADRLLQLEADIAAATGRNPA